MGRRLSETMPCWETADQDQALSDAELEWTALWNPASEGGVLVETRTFNSQVVLLRHRVKR
ncbi:hypothetical protein ACFYZ5_29055 [Streptomyces chartreusis]|uniref:hypothetical protein n=1 Tax=Streptomyces chartreusis TaxID=1969 RepID=UPI003682E948